jgi:hypothetical protein
MSISIVDETLSGNASEAMKLIFNTELITVKEVIARRVTAEVESYNLKLTGFFNGLVEPTNAEKILNGYQLKPRQPIDAKKQIETALDAFQKNGFFILVDNKQFEHLDDEIIVADTTTISFVKLTPLVGG